MSRNAFIVAALAALAAATASCGNPDYGRAPATPYIIEMTASPGGTSPSFGGYLHSDVVRIVQNVPTRFNDVGRVGIGLVLKDPGAPGITAAPSPQNNIMFTRYRVVYRRTDGRNVQGVDVPYAFDSGVTFTATGTGGADQTFDIVRLSAKAEAPLAALASNGQSIDCIADVTFFGKDMHGNNVSVTGSIGITFANYADSTT